MQKNLHLLNPPHSVTVTGVKSVSRHEEALAGGGSFAQQGGLIAQDCTISAKIARYHPRSPKITKDHPRLAKITQEC